MLPWHFSFSPCFSFNFQWICNNVVYTDARDFSATLVPFRFQFPFPAPCLYYHLVYFVHRYEISFCLVNIFSSRQTNAMPYLIVKIVSVCTLGCLEVFFFHFKNFKTTIFRYFGPRTSDLSILFKNFHGNLTVPGYPESKCGLTTNDFIFHQYIIFHAFLTQLKSNVRINEN